jgi:RNA polymerase sigma factor (sigma-70 family)
MRSGSEMDSDAQLMDRTRAGDGDAFAELVKRYQMPIYGYLARRAGTSAAEDLLAEVWIAAFRGRGNFNGRFDSARPWLFTMARHALSEHWRRLPQGTPTTDGGHSDPWPEVDERLDAAGAAEHLRAAVSELPELQREVLLLVAWEDLTPSEVAVVLNIPPATVRSHLHRARRSLSNEPSVVTAGHPPAPQRRTEHG